MGAHTRRLPALAARTLRVHNPAPSTISLHNSTRPQQPPSPRPPAPPAAHLALAFSGDAAPAPGGGVLLHKAHGLQLLQRVADDAARRLGVVLGRGGARGVGAAAKGAAEGAHAHALPHVHAPGNSRCGGKQVGQEGGVVRWCGGM